DRDKQLPNLLLDSYFKDIAEGYQSDLRKVLAVAIENGIAVPGFSAALSYYDSYRSERLPANLLQAQRDYFGAHTYERVDKEGHFHTEWLKAKFYLKNVQCPTIRHMVAVQETYIPKFSGVHGPLL